MTGSEVAIETRRRIPVTQRGRDLMSVGLHSPFDGRAAVTVQAPPRVRARVLDDSREKLGYDEVASNLIVETIDMTRRSSLERVQMRFSLRGLRFLWAGLLGVALIAGCSSTKVSNRQEYEGPTLPRPGRIIVYDFAVSPADLPAWSKASNMFAQAAVKMSAADLEAGHKLGADVAKTLVAKIDAMGINAVRSAGQLAPALNDIVLIGYFTSIDKGSGVERVLIGFGEGSANVGAHAEGYHMTANGLVQLGSGTTDAGGTGKMPGLVVPALVTIATANPIGLVVGGAVKAEGEISGRTTAEGSADRIADEIAKILKSKFEEQGWI